MKNGYYFAISLIFLISGCVSIERDIYFKNKNSIDPRTISSSRPGSNFESSPIKTPDQIDRKVYLMVDNYADGSYAWGIIVPILPVFFLPQMKFSLDNHENLKIRCVVGVQYGPQYLQKWDHAGSRDLYELNKEGIELSEKLRKLGNGSCSSVNIELPDGQIIKPTKTEIEDKSGATLFTFNTVAASISEFVIKISQIRLASNEKIDTDIKFNAILEDWTRYYLAPIAP